MGKVKLSIDGQIDYMKNKSGIQFNIINEEEAKDFLTNNTYYFKIKSYCLKLMVFPGKQGTAK